LEALARRLGTIRLRRVNVSEWESDVARQYGIRRLPALWLYDGHELLSEDAREVLEILQGR
jgi:hypothetical protein